MRYLILGSTEAVRDDGTSPRLGGTRLRALVAALALRAGRPVPAWALIEEIWDGDAPGDPADALQTLVARLRRALGPDAVVSGADGYRLPDAAVPAADKGGAADRPTPAASRRDGTDLGAFERLTAAAASAPPQRRLALLDEALALWRGEPLADLPAREDVRTRLAAQRETAVLARADARLALGLAAEALPELAELTQRHPLDEPAHLLHLRALAALGRGADALLCYEALRHRLADALGTDPGPELRALHVQLLTQPDPPDAAPAKADVPHPPAPTPALTPAPPSAAAPAPARPGNVRARLTSFVGREADLDALRAEVSGHRLVTLTGPGGSGKTRLSQELAQAVQRTPHVPPPAAAPFPDGAWLVELAPLDDPSAVPDAVLNALGLRATQLHVNATAETLTSAVESGTPVQRLVEHCAPRRLLLLLDNCEHVIAAAADLAAELTAACPGVTVLATSREALGVPGERVHPVEPLPDRTALRLFAERGAAARPGFDPARDDPEACVEICRRLDGLPLAIELAAARLRGLTPRQLADRLDDRFRLLTGGSRTHLPRQQTLRAVVDWSWDLLEDAERALLARLSVFAGGCTLEAAEEVCADPAAQPTSGPGKSGNGLLPAADVAPTLLSLVDKSLVQARLDAEPRYTLLETIGEYAGERLDERGERPALTARHYAWSLELTRALDPDLRTGHQIEALARFETEHDNLRAALRRAIAAADEQQALALLLGLAWFWTLRDYRAEAQTWCRAVCALVPGIERPETLFAPEVMLPTPVAPQDVPPPWSPEVLAEARRAAVLYRLMTSEDDFGTERTEEALALSRVIIAAYDAGLPQAARLPAVIRPYVGMFAVLLHSLPEIVDDTVRGCREHSRPWELACALQIRAKMLEDQAASREQARQDAAESLAVFTELGDRWGIVEALTAAIELSSHEGDFARAAELSRRALVLADELGARQDEAVLRVRLGDALLGLGDVEAGERELRAGIEAARDTSQIVQGGFLGNMLLAGLVAWRGDTAQARELLAEVSEVMERPHLEDVGPGRNVINGLVSMVSGWLDAMEGRPEEGLRRLQTGLEAVLAHPMAIYMRDQLPAVLGFYAAYTYARCAEAGAVPEAEPALRAAKILGARHAARDSHPTNYLDAQNLAATEDVLRTLLTPAAYAQAFAEGEAIPRDQILDLFR